MKPFVPALALFLLFTTAADAAGYKGEISFTEEEIATHKAGIGTSARETARCLKEELERHRYFHERIGISALYGDQSGFAQKKVDGVVVATTKEEKRAQLRALGLEDGLVYRPHEPVLRPRLRGRRPRRSVEASQGLRARQRRGRRCLA